MQQQRGETRLMSLGSGRLDFVVYFVLFSHFVFLRTSTDDYELGFKDVCDGTPTDRRP